MATSETSICNLALQKLGAGRIASLSENSPKARACSDCYEAMRDKELRAHRWSFAITRAELAADATDPAFGPTKQYTLPVGFLRLLEPDDAANDNMLDWRIEGRVIVTDYTAPLQIRYIERVTDPTLFDATFVDALACRIALQICETVTQSTSKKADVKDEYKDSVREARRTNAIEGVSAEPPTDPWITARL